MDIAIFTQAAQLGGTVFTVLLFLWYLSKRDNKWTDSLKASSDSNVVLAKALQRLTDIVEKNSNVSVANTDKISENINTNKKNIEATVENTDAIVNNRKK